MIDRLKAQGLISDGDESNAQDLTTYASLHQLGDAPPSVGIRYQNGETYSRALESYTTTADWLMAVGGVRRFAVAGFLEPIIGDSVRQIEVIEADPSEQDPITGLNQIYLVKSSEEVEAIAAQRELSVTRLGKFKHLGFVSIPVSERLHIKVRDHHISTLFADLIIQKSLGPD